MFRKMEDYFMKRGAFLKYLRSLTALVLALMIPFNAMAAALPVNGEEEQAVQTREVEPVMTLPAALTDIPAQMLMGNEAVEEIILQDGVLNIGEQAFADCKALVHIVIPESVEFIAENAFENAQEALFIDAPVDSYAAQWAREHGIATNEPEAVLEAAFEHYYPTLYLQGNLDGVVVGFAQAEYPLAEGENIEWQLDKVSGSDVANLYINQTSENGRFAWVYADSVHATGSSEWRLTALAPDGQEWSTGFTTTVKTLPENLPTELIIDEPIKVDVGERFEFKPSQLVSCNGVIPETDNWNHYGLQVYYELVNDPTYEQIEDGDNGAFAFTPATDGRYGVLVTLYLGNHAITREAILWVGTGVSSTAYLHVVENDPLYISDSNHFWIGSVDLMRFPMLEEETAVVSAELLESTGEEAAVFFHFEQDPDVNRTFWNMVADGFSGEPGTDVYRIRVAVGESVFTYDYEIEVREVTENMPTGITVPQTYYEVEIGDTLTLYNDDIQFVDGEIPEDASLETGYWGLSQILHEQEVTDTGDGVSFHFVQNGTYEIDAVKALGGKEYRLPITIKVGTGISDAAHILAQQYLHTIYLDVENEDNWVGSFDVQDYELHENENYYWALEMISDPAAAPVELYIDGEYENWRGVNLHYDNLSGETGSVTYRLTVTTDEGLERSVEVSIDVAELPEGLPTGITVPQTAYELDPGDTLKLYYSDIVFTGGKVPDGLENRTEYWEVENASACEWTEEGVVLTFNEEGRYQILAAGRLGNMSFTQPILVKVGTAINATLEHYYPTLFVGGNLEEAVVAYLTFDGALGEGETIEWNVEKVSGSDCVDFYVSEDGQNALVYARNVNAEGETVWRATAQLSDGASWSQEFATTVVSLPDDMPTQFIGPDSMVCVVGQRVEVVHDELLATDGVWPEGKVSSVGLRDLWGYETYEYTEDGFAFTPLEKGEYWINRRVTLGNYQIAGEFVFIVVGDGNVVFDHYFPTLYVGGNLEEIDVASLWFDGALGENESIAWNVEKVSGSDCVDFYVGDVSEDGLNAFVNARNVTAEGEAVWRATAQLPDGTSWSQEFTTTVIPLPEDIPAELEVDYPMYAELGERFEFKPSERIHNLDAFPDNGNRCSAHVAYYTEIWEDPTHEFIDDGANGAFAFTPSKSDRYGFSLYYYIGNHVVEHHGILVIGDGTTERDVLFEDLIEVVYIGGAEEAWLGNLIVERYHLLPGEEVAWTIDLIDSSNETPAAEVFISDLFENTRGANLMLAGLSGEPGTVTYRITASVGGSVLTHDYVLVVAERSDEMPTGITVPQTSYELNVGDTLTLYYSDIEFTGGQVPDGVEYSKEYWIPETGFGCEWIEEGIVLTFDHDGRCVIDAAGRIGNFDFVQPITITVGTGIPADAEIAENQFFPVQYVNMDGVNWVGDFELRDLQVLDGEELKWSIERIDGGEYNPGNVVIDHNSDDGLWAGLHMYDFTGETGSTTWRVTVESSLGYTISEEYVIEVVEKPETAPTDIAVPDEVVYLEVGETYYVNRSDYGFANGEVPEDAVVHFDVMSGNLEDVTEVQWTEEGFHFSIDVEGTYEYHVSGTINGMELFKTVYVIVGDGGLANAALAPDQVLHTAYYGADHDAYVGSFGIDGYRLLPGEAYEWSLELISAPEGNMPVTLLLSDEYDDGNGINIHATGINDGTGTVTYRLHLKTDKLALSTDITIDVVDLPETLPTELQIPASEYAFEVGDTFELLFEDISVANGEIPEGVRVDKEYWEFEAISGHEWTENGLRFTFETEGRYTGYAVVRIGNYTVRKPIAITVGDGLAGDAVFTWHQKYSKLYRNIDNVEYHIGWFDIENYELPEGESFYWSLEQVEGPEIMGAHWEARNEDASHVWVYTGWFNGETGTAVYRLKVWAEGGFSYSVDFEIEVTDCPDGLPTEVIVPQTEYHFEIGDSYEFRNEVLELGEGTVPEDAYIIKEYWGLEEIPGAELIHETDAIDGDGWRITFDRNGRYQFDAVIKIESYTLTVPCTITVGTGYSDDTYVEWIQDLHIIYTDLPEFSTWIGCAYLNNYTVLNDEDVSWTLERVDGGEDALVELYYTHETGWVEEAHIRYTNIQGTGSVTYRLTVNTEAGFTDSHEFTVTVEPLPDDLPTDIDVQTYYEIGVGEMFVFDANNASFADGTVPENASTRYHVNGGDFDYFRSLETFEWLDSGFQVSFDQEGRYVFGFGMQVGNYTLRKDIYIVVGDGVGDNVYLDLWTPMNPVYVGTDYSWLGSAYVQNFRLLDDETIAWSFQQKDPDATPAITMYTTNDPCTVDFDVLEEAVAGDYAYVVEATLPTGDVLQQELALQLQELPEGLPTELVAPESFTMNVGEEMVIMHGDVAFGEGDIPEDATINTQIWTDGELEQTADLEWVVTGDNEEGLLIRPHMSGEFTITVAKLIGNYRITKDIPLAVTDSDWKIAVMTGSEAQGSEEYTAAQMVLGTYGPEHVVLDIYPDNFTSEISTTIARINAFAEDPAVKAIIVEQAVPGTVSAFEQVAESRDDVLLIAAMPQEIISMTRSAADIVLMSDEADQAGPIMDKCEEWGIEAFVHLSFPRHLAYEEVAARRDLLRSRAEELGVEFVEVTIPDPTADEGVEFSCNYVAEKVAEYAETYAGQKVAFYSTACGVQAALQSAVLAFDNAYYPSPCCPSPFHGFGESLGLGFDMSDPSGALRQIANALNEQGAAGRFSTGIAPVNMGVLEVAAQYAAAYAQGAVHSTNDGAFLMELFDNQFGRAYVSTGDYDNVYTILMPLVDFNGYVSGGGTGKIAILTGTSAQGEEEYTAAQMAVEAYGADRVITDTYPDNFIDEMDTTIEKLLAFADDPEVKAIIVAQSVPGTLDAFKRISESRDDVLLISGMPQEDIGEMSAAADVVMMTDEAAHAAPIMNRCAAWDIEVFVHYSFERHLGTTGVANRLAGIKAAAETLGIEVVEVEMPDPVEDGLDAARSFILANVPEQMAAYEGKKVAFFATNCGVQASLQTAVLNHGNAYYPQPCCPSPFHGFGESLGLDLDLRNPSGALTAIANELNKNLAAGRFSTWPVPVNMGIIDVAAEFAMAYVDGHVEGNDANVIADMFSKRCGTDVSVSESGNVYTIVLEPINFTDYVVDENTTITLWVAENSMDFTQRQVDTFMAANEQYADLKVRLESVGEGDAADRVLESDEELVDMFVFAQDQLARLVTAGRLSVVSDENAAVIARANDDGSVSAVQVGDTTYAYPVTSDNGYFLYYDSSVVTDPSSLESIIASCEAAGKGVLMEVNSGWYQPAFFFGAGCTLTYDIDSEGNFVSCNVDYASENGVRALKAMMALTSSESFENRSDTSSVTEIGAIVSGTWIAQEVQKVLGGNYAAVKLPTADGFQMSGFGGFKMLGVRPQPNEHKQEACEALAMYLTSEEVQSARYNEVGWGPSNLNAQQSEAVQNDVALAALADQLQYCVPQGQYPDAYWDLAKEFGDRVILGEFDGMTDEELLEVLTKFQQAAIAIVAGEEPIRLRWAMGSYGSAPADNEMVLEELNAMSRELIGVECDIEYYNDAELQAAIAAGEEFDIMFTCDWFNNTNSLISQGLLLDVAGVVESVAPDMYASMDERVWQLAKTGGSLYAIPVKKDYAAMHFITYPSDKAAQLGFEIPEKISAWSDLTPFLQAWKATVSDTEYPVQIGGAARGLESTFDFINSTAMIGCVYGTSDVVTVFDDPEIMERYRTLADWYSKGLINPDAPTITESELDTSKPRIQMVQAWPGYDFSGSNGYNTEMTGYTKAMLTRDGVWGGMNALSSHLENDPDRRDAALKYLELCYTNQLFMDTLRYGVQGYHWNYVTEEESEACAGGVLRTSAGTSSYSPWGFAQPGYFNVSIAVSQDQVNGTAKAPNMNQYDLYYDAIENDGVVSALGAFKWDSTAWESQLAEMIDIKDEYYANFATGAVSIDDVYDEFMAKMNAAGLQDMIADAQAQLDAYLGK